MKLEIIDAVDKGDKFVLKMEYDAEFAQAVAQLFGVKHADEEEIEDFVAMVLENLTTDDLGEPGNEID